MTRARTDDAPTPVNNRARIVALEAEVDRLGKVIEQLEHQLDIQLQRIGQLQVNPIVAGSERIIVSDESIHRDRAHGLLGSGSTATRSIRSTTGRTARA